MEELAVIVPEADIEGKSKKNDSYVDRAVNRNIWKDMVSIASTGKVHDVYITTEINLPIEYNKLVHFLWTVPSNHTVRLHVNNGGGILDSAVMIIDAIDKCKATVKAYISGTVASAATMIVLACDELEVADHTQWLSHSASHGFQGKQSDMQAYAVFANDQLTASMELIHKGFLSKKEIKAIVDGKEHWMNKDEVETRWETRSKLRKSK